MTVSGFTMVSLSAQSVQILDSRTQKSRSLFFRCGRLTDRCRTVICCRNARFSKASSRWVARVEIRVLSSVEIMRAIVNRIGWKLNVFNKDGVYGSDTLL